MFAELPDLVLDPAVVRAHLTKTLRSCFLNEDLLLRQAQLLTQIPTCASPGLRTVVVEKSLTPFLI